MSIQWLCLANATAKKMTMSLLAHKTPQATYFFRTYLQGLAKLSMPGECWETPAKLEFSVKNSSF